MLNPLDVLSRQQREIWNLRLAGWGAKRIAKALGVRAEDVKKQLGRIEKKLSALEGEDKNVQNDPSRGSCVFDELACLVEECPPLRRTVNEYRVLSLAGRGMTVRQAAKAAGKSEQAVYKILRRSGIRAADFSARKMTEEELAALGEVPSPRDEEMELLSHPALSLYRRCVEAGKATAEEEVVLRAAGFIRRGKAVARNNAGTVKALLAQKAMAVVALDRDAGRAAKPELDHHRARLLHVDVSGEEKKKVYAVPKPAAPMVLAGANTEN